jgi:D-inositol-3-phosphate glycosyltransferase
VSDQLPLPRVLYSFPHPLDRPGIAQTALQQVLGLERLGLGITVICTSVGSAVLPARLAVHQTMVVAGRRVPHRAIGVQRAYDYHDLRVAHWLRRHARQVDVLHAWPRGCLRSLDAARAVGIAAVRESPNPHTASVMRASTAAAADAGVPLPPNHSHAANPAVLAKEEAEYRAATAVLVPSDYARGEFLAEGFPADRLLQHRYGCDLGRFPARTAARPNRPFRAVFLGRGDPTKGLHVALRAWALADLPAAEFLIAGEVLPDYARAISGQLNLPGVRAVGFIADVPRFLLEADVLVLPSWTEGSALVTIEAQASGCVPLVSEASGALGRPGVDYLVHPVGAADVLAAQLRQLAGDPARLAPLSAPATPRRDFYSWVGAAQTQLGCSRAAIARAARPEAPV